MKLNFQEIVKPTAVLFAICVVISAALAGTNLLTRDRIAQQELLKAEGVKARVISMPSFELFEAQSDEYKESVMPSNVRARVAVEAAATFGWHKYVGLDGAVIGLDHFGASAPYKLLFQEFGFTAENVAATAKKVIG